MGVFFYVAYATKISVAGGHLALLLSGRGRGRKQTVKFKTVLIMNLNKVNRLGGQHVMWPAATVYQKATFRHRISSEMGPHATAW